MLGQGVDFTFANNNKKKNCNKESHLNFQTISVEALPRTPGLYLTFGGQFLSKVVFYDFALTTIHFNFTTELNSFLQKVHSNFVLEAVLCLFSMCIFNLSSLSTSYGH